MNYYILPNLLLIIFSFVMFFRAAGLKKSRDKYKEIMVTAINQSLYYKRLADKFIRLNNQSLDQLDKLIDKRKFNGTKHAKR